MGVFTELLDKFIAKYVCCENCHLPEIDIWVKKGVVGGKCLACGWNGELDNMHKLAIFISKNPPDSSGYNIKGGDETDDDDTASYKSDEKKDAEKKEKKEKKDKKDK